MSRKSQVGVTSDAVKKVGMFGIYTRRISQGKVRADELPAILAMALEHLDHVTLQFVMNVIKRFRYLKEVREFSKKMYEHSFIELGRPQALWRFEDLSRMSIVCGLFLGKAEADILKKIEKVAGKPYRPQKKTLRESGVVAKGAGCALADNWKVNAPH